MRFIEAGEGEGSNRAAEGDGRRNRAAEEEEGKEKKQVE